MNACIIFWSGIHDVRPHKGQKMVARRLRSLLHSDTHRSEIAGNINIMHAQPLTLKTFISFQYFISFLNFLDYFNNFIKCNIDINQMKWEITTFLLYFFLFLDL